jgi:hypothetical protein
MFLPILSAVLVLSSKSSPCLEKSKRYEDPYDSLFNNPALIASDFGQNKSLGSLIIELCTLAETYCDNNQVFDLIAKNTETYSPDSSPNATVREELIKHGKSLAILFHQKILDDLKGSVNSIKPLVDTSGIKEEIRLSYMDFGLKYFDQRYSDSINHQLKQLLCSYLTDKVSEHIDNYPMELVKYYPITVNMRKDMENKQVNIKCFQDKYIYLGNINDRNNKTREEVIKRH